MSKRGINAVISSVLLIVIVMVAIVIIFNVIKSPVSSLENTSISAITSQGLVIQSNTVSDNGTAVSFLAEKDSTTVDSAEIAGYVVILEDDSGQTLTQEFIQEVNNFETIRVTIYYNESLYSPFVKISLHTLFKTSSGESVASKIPSEIENNNGFDSQPEEGSEGEGEPEPEQNITSLSPIGSWLLNENTGATAGDSSGNNNPGTITGSSWITGINGSALSFDGVDDHVEIGSPEEFNFDREDFSLSVWVKTPSVDPSSTIYTIVSKWAYSNSISGFSLATKEGEYRLQLGDASPCNVVWYSGFNTPITENTWEHLVLTVDRDDSAKLYVNGQEEDSVDISSGLLCNLTNTYSLNIGSRSGEFFFNGEVDEVEIYNKSLNSSEVSDKFDSYNFTLIEAERRIAFPGAEGFGQYAKGGQDGQIYIIQNLNDAGPGSLRECAEATGKRYCLFNISGAINLQSDIEIESPFITLAGQTSPDSGIEVRDKQFIINTHNVILQHMKFRHGGVESGKDSLAIGFDNTPPLHDIMIDHVSVSWASDGLLDIAYNNHKDITIQNSIISEAFYLGSLLGWPYANNTNISVIKNYFAHNVGRNPFVQTGNSAEVINNFVFNWRHEPSRIEGNTNVIGNHYIAGHNTTVMEGVRVNTIEGNYKIYVEDNIGPTRTASDPEWDIVYFNIPAEDIPLVQSPTPIFQGSNTTILNAADVPLHVVTNAGSHPNNRDVVDARVLTDVSLYLAESLVDVGGWHTLPVVYGSWDLPANPHGDDDQDGFSNLEEWLYQMALTA